MIMPIDIHPKHSLYYNGAVVLSCFKEANTTAMLLVDLVLMLDKKMSINLLTAVLDWLFLVDIAILNEKGMIELCTSKH